MAAVAQNDGQVGHERLRDAATIGGRSLGHHLGKAHNHVERGAQFVAYPSHKVSLELLRGLGRLAGLIELLRRQHKLAIEIGGVLKRLGQLDLASLCTVALGLSSGHERGSGA